MLKRINLIRNIGCFDSFSGSRLGDLKKLVLIYAENGRGKTTISAILSSLANNDGSILMGRKRLGASHGPHVILNTESGNTILQDSIWDHYFNNIFVYDDEFVSQSVYSGLEITANHRQKLHEVILGRRGVSLARGVDDITQQISECNRKIRETSNQIPYDRRFGLDIDTFCNLPRAENIEHAIEEKQKEYDAVVQANIISQKPVFSKISFPIINIRTLEDVLSKGLSDLDEAAVQSVKEHFSLIGNRAEEWIATGVEKIINKDTASEKCPFCGQAVRGIDLINKYKAYFGEAYRTLNQNITLQITQHEASFSGDQLSLKQEETNKLFDLHKFWKQFVDLPKINIDWSIISTAWQEARGKLFSSLGAKRTSPLNPVTLTVDAVKKINNYLSVITGVQNQIESLVDLNSRITEIKALANSGNLQNVRNGLNRIKATQSRYSDDLKDLCDQYLLEVKQRTILNKEKEISRVALDDYRDTVFLQYYTSINAHLELFGANFRIGGLQSSNAAGHPSTTYHLIVNDCQVPLANQGNTSDLPCFKNTLSAGDRNTLALAFFFASIENEPNLNNSIIALDDPISSLDDGRTVTTIQKIRGLVSGSKQVIVLCHLRSFLCDIWEHSDKGSTTALIISRAINNTSDITLWDVDSDALTEYDKRHKVLRDYVESDIGDKRNIAQCLRPVMEKYLRITFPEHCTPGTLLGKFQNRVENLLRNEQRIMSDASMCELRHITEYANKFHHDTNPAWETEHINDSELLGFVKRVLNFVRQGII